MRPSVPRCGSSSAFVPQRGGFQLRVLPYQLSGRNRPSVKRLSSPKAEFLIHFFASLPFPRIAPNQISHSEKFDNLLSLNDVAEPGSANVPQGHRRLARGNAPGLPPRSHLLRPARGAGIAPEITLLLPPLFCFTPWAGYGLN